MLRTLPLRRLDTGALIARVRRSARLTQEELAARAGTTQSAISRWEAGHDAPRLDTLVTILASCDIDADLVFRGRDDVDRAQIRAHLALTPTERLRAQANVSRFRHRARRRDAGTVRS